MAPARRQKIASSIRGELSRVIQMEMNDPRVGFITVTGVEVSPDLRVANVYFSKMGDPTGSQATLEALDKARGFLRRRVADNLALRRTPELRFHLDHSADHGERIERLLQKLDITSSEQPGPEESDPEDDDTR